MADYALTHYDFSAFPGNVVTDDPDPKYSLFGAKCQYKLTIEASGGKDFIGKHFYFNPAMFKPMTIPTPPDPHASLKGWFGSTTGLSAGSSNNVLSLVAGGNEENVRNFSATFDYVTDTKLYIYLNFYMIFDIENFVNSALQDNKKKFTYNKISAGSPFTNTSPSIYNEKRSMWFYFALHKDTDSTMDYEYFYGKPGDLQSKFYNVGYGNTAPDHTFTSVKLRVATQIQTAIATTIDTEVEFKFSGSSALPGKIYAVLYRTDVVDNSLNYVSNGINGFAEITTVVGGTTIDGTIKGPADKTQVGGDTTVKFNLDHNLIVDGARYFVALQIFDTVDMKWTAFISPEFSTYIPSPDPIYPDIVTDGFKDYLNTYGPDIIAPVQERVLSFAEFDKASYTTRVETKYGSGSGSYASNFQNMTIRISDATTSEILYSKDISNGVVRTDSGDTVHFEHEFRLRHDEAKTWEGRSLLIQWMQQFFLPKTETGLTEDHTDVVILNQFIKVRCYDNDPCVDYGTTSLTLKQCDGAALTGICGNNPDCVLVTATNRDAVTDSKVIAYIDNHFYSAASILEEETFTGLLPQKLNNTLYDVPTDFTSGQAQFKIDTSQLIQRVQYRVSITTKYTSTPSF